MSDTQNALTKEAEQTVAQLIQGGWKYENLVRLVMEAKDLQSKYRHKINELNDENLFSKNLLERNNKIQSACSPSTQPSPSVSPTNHTQG